MADPFPDPDLVSFPHPPQRVNVNSAGMDATSEPSSKRKRTESTDTQSNPLPTRSKEFWLDDGSIVLHVENTLFRVHRTQLSANSEVFRNMFSVPQPALKQGEEIEGCPIVRLPDLAADWTYVLAALYDASKCYHKEGPMPFAQAAAFLRLGSKYEITQLRSEALRRFVVECPSTLSEWDFVIKNEWTEIVAQKAIWHDMFNLARETGHLRLLPAAFLSLAAYLSCLAQIMDGSKRLDGSVALLSPEDRRICVLGVEMLRRWQHQESLKWLDTTDDSLFMNCEDHTQCTSQRRKTFYDIFQSGQHIMSFEGWAEDDEVGLCEPCIAESKILHHEGRLKVWNELPSMLGLPDWDELIKA